MGLRKLLTMREIYSKEIGRSIISIDFGFLGIGIVHDATNSYGIYLLFVGVTILR